MSKVDIAFSIRGTRIPRDHGYWLYSALSKVLPEIHEADWLAIHPLGGARRDGDQLQLSHTATLRMRVPGDRIPLLLRLVGANLEIGDSNLRIGQAQVHPLIPSSSLDARLVAVKLTDVPRRQSETEHRQTLDVMALTNAYAAALDRQLRALQITSTATLQGRQSITVAGKRVIGFSVRVSGLSAEQSIRLQDAGLGGKHRMGCGIFRPTRDRHI